MALESTSPTSDQAINTLATDVANSYADGNITAEERAKLQEDWNLVSPTGDPERLRQANAVLEQLGLLDVVISTELNSDTGRLNNNSDDHYKKEFFNPYVTSTDVQDRALGYAVTDRFKAMETINDGEAGLSDGNNDMSDGDIEEYTKTADQRVAFETSWQALSERNSNTPQEFIDVVEQLKSGDNVAGFIVDDLVQKIEDGTITGVTDEQLAGLRFIQANRQRISALSGGGYGSDELFNMDGIRWFAGELGTSPELALDHGAQIDALPDSTPVEEPVEDPNANPETDVDNEERTTRVESGDGSTTEFTYSGDSEQPTGIANQNALGEREVLSSDGSGQWSVTTYASDGTPSGPRPISAPAVDTTTGDYTYTDGTTTVIQKGTGVRTESVAGQGGGFTSITVTDRVGNRNQARQTDDGSWELINTPAGGSATTEPIDQPVRLEDGWEFTNPSGARKTIVKDSGEHSVEEKLNDNDTVTRNYDIHGDLTSTSRFDARLKITEDYDYTPGSNTVGVTVTDSETGESFSTDGSMDLSTGSVSFTVPDESVDIYGYKPEEIADGESLVITKKKGGGQLQTVNDEQTGEVNRVLRSEWFGENGYNGMRYEYTDGELSGAFGQGALSGTNYVRQSDGSFVRSTDGKRFKLDVSTTTGELMLASAPEGEPELETEAPVDTAPDEQAPPEEVPDEEDEGEGEGEEDKDEEEEPDEETDTIEVTSADYGPYAIAERVLGADAPEQAKWDYIVKLFELNGLPVKDVTGDGNIYQDDLDIINEDDPSSENYDIINIWWAEIKEKGEMKIPA